MKKILFILIAFVIGFQNQVSAQTSPLKVGFRAGINVADWRGDAVESFSELAEMSSVFKTESFTGFHAGVNLEIPVTGAFSIEPGLYYSTKGMRVSQTILEGGFLNLKGEITSKLHYIELPVLAKVYLTEGFYLTGGPQVGFLASNRMRAEAGILGFSVGDSFDVNAGFRKVDFGLVGGLGYQFQNGINISALYDHGLSTLDEGNSDIDAYNRAFKISLGFQF